MRRSIVLAAGLVAAIAGGVLAWRRNPRVGTRFVNRRINPLLVDRRLSGAGRSEFGTIEHIGRRSGMRRLTPVHPEFVADEIRIMVPLGARSEWARNVLAAGHCRMQWRDVVYELDEPQFVSASEVAGLSRPIGAVAHWLGFMYLRLHRFGEWPGTLETGAPAQDLVHEKAAPIGDEADDVAAAAGVPADAVVAESTAVPEALAPTI